MKKLLLLLALTSMLATPALAYDMTNLRTDMKAHIEKMMKVVGDVTIQQEATFEAAAAGMSAMKATTYIKGNRWRSDAVMKATDKGKGMDLEVTSLYDGSDMWSVTMGMKQKLPKGMMGQHGPNGLWNEFPEGAKVTGEEKVNGRDAWKVLYAAAKGAPKSNDGPTTVWVDKATFMPIQMESEAGGKPVRIVMSDFRNVKGYEMPHLTEMFSDGKKTMTMKVIKLETNKGLSDDLFDPEQLAGGDGMDMNAMMKKAMEMQKQMEGQGKKGGE
jgi:outer membrane lipoprotein-sorting protein